MGRVRDFFRKESAGGILLLVSAILALIVANTPLYETYDHLLHTKLGFAFDNNIALKESLLHWINDGLMAFFFLLVGLEVKREMREGELKNPSKASLPIIAAAGGMIVPALIYVAFNFGSEDTLKGWAIPAATDIAFALGILALLGSRTPPSLKVFLATLAIIDDLGAIIIIALFYTQDLSVIALGVAAAMLVILFILNRKGVTKFTPYMVFGLILWVAVLKSGVHATLAGVALAMFIPLRNPQNHDHSPVRDLEHKLNPIVYFAILPIFAFANSGVSFAEVGLSSFTDPMALGIILGLFAGKQLGVFSFSYVALKAGWSRMPSEANYRHIYGVAALCGIGFTMSLFIAGLAFGGDKAAEARLSILTGSLLSGLLGYFLLSKMKDRA